MTDQQPAQQPVIRKRGRPRKSAGGRHLVSARLTEERYKALLKDAEDNTRSISEEVEHRLNEWPIAAEILAIKKWFDQSSTDRIKQLEAYTDELRRERNEAIQILLDLQQVPMLSEDVRRALDQAIAGVFAKLLGTGK